jgi:hypothetical protein
MVPDNPSQQTTDGTLLPDQWRATLPTRWVLNPAHPQHCEACLSFAGEYDNWRDMVDKTNGAEPGFFPACARPTEMKDASQLVACWDACQCWVEVKVAGQWKRLE